MPRKQRGGWLAVLAVMLVVAWACRNPTHGLDWGWSGQHESEPLDTFSHQAHRAVFQREQIQCFACHTMTARIPDEQEAAAAIRASHETFVGGKEACHSCHFNPEAGNTAPDRCGLCHLDAGEVAPANHNHDWMARHVVFAKADAQGCESCHQPRQCQDCHNRRDQTVRSFHDRTIRFTHGIEARANPMRCGQCHSPGFCQRCHVEGGYEK